MRWRIGLSRFDGQHFTAYTSAHGLPGATLTDLVETRGGVYWIATEGAGVVRLEATTAHARAHAGAGEKRWSSGGPAGPRFTAHPISREPRSASVNVLREDRAGRLWAGTDGGLFLVEGVADPVRFTPVELGLGSASGPARVHALAEDREGTLWIGTSVGLARRLPDGRIVRHPAFAETDGLLSRKVRALHQTKGGPDLDRNGQRPERIRR